MAMHIEQPASRHSAPASLNTRSRPSASAAFFTLCEPGTTSARTPGATLRPRRQSGRCPQIRQARVGAAADEDHVDGVAEQGLVRLQAHVLEGLLHAGVGRRRHRSGDADAHPGIGAVGDHRLERAGVEPLLAIEDRALVGGQRSPALQGAVPVGALGRTRAPGQVLVGGVVGGAHAGARARLDRHVTDGHALFHGERRGMAEPRYSMTWPVPPPMPIRAMTARMMSLAVTPGLQRPLDGDGQGLWPLLQQALGGEHVRDFAGADAEGERPESAVRAGVAVAADDGRARLGQAQLRADHMHDPLPLTAQRKQLDAVLAAIGFELRYLRFGLGVDDAELAVGQRGAGWAWSGPSWPRCAPASGSSARARAGR